MKTKKYYKRKSNGVEVEAVAFIPDQVVLSDLNIQVTEDGQNYFIDHPNRRHTCIPGCVLIRRASGHLYPFSQEYFVENYEFVREVTEHDDSDGN
jgi:hypothetical protein